jgi:endonuclease G
MKQVFTRIGSLSLLALLAISCAKIDSVAPAPDSISVAQAPSITAAVATATRDSNLALGNPSGAVASTSYPTNYLLSKTQYTMSYNRDQGKPNWVSWHLSSAWLGSTARQDNFSPDASLPTGWYQVTTSDYTGSGFDRGHNCPSADRTGSVTDNSATFLMSNMMPQASVNNQQTWAGLENYCRTLVNAGNELYIVCGSYGKGGTGVNGYATTIAGGITTSTRVIAINTPNTTSIGTAWGAYRTSVDKIEAATGLDLLSALSTTIQNTLETKTDAGATN